MHDDPPRRNDPYGLPIALAVAAIMLGAITWHMARSMEPSAGLGAMILIYPTAGAFLLALLAHAFFFAALRRHEDGPSRRRLVVATRVVLHVYAGAWIGTAAVWLISMIQGTPFWLGWVLMAPVY